MLTEEEVKSKLDELINKLDNVPIGTKERNNLRKQIYNYRHYQKRLAKSNERKKIKRNENKLSGFEESTMFLSSLQYELWDSKKTADIKLNPDFAKKYWG